MPFEKFERPLIFPEKEEAEKIEPAKIAEKLVEIFEEKESDLYKTKPKIRWKECQERLYEDLSKSGETFGITIEQAEEIGKELCKKEIGEKIGKSSQGILISSVFKSAVEQYKTKEKEKGIAPEEIENFVIKLKIEPFSEKEKERIVQKAMTGKGVILAPPPTIEQRVSMAMIAERAKKLNPTEFRTIAGEEEFIHDLGYKNPEKCHLIIEGDVGKRLGNRMEGGIIELKGNAGREVGKDMKKGKLIIDGEVESFAESAFSAKNEGEIWWKGRKVWPISPQKAGELLEKVKERSGLMKALVLIEKILCPSKKSEKEIRDIRDLRKELIRVAFEIEKLLEK